MGQKCEMSMNAPNPNARFPRIMSALKNANGFMRADNLYTVVEGERPDLRIRKDENGETLPLKSFNRDKPGDFYENPDGAMKFHSFLSELDTFQTMSEGMISQGFSEEGIAKISWRRKTDVKGLDDNNFPKAWLPPDPTPPQKRRTKKDGDSETKITKDWIPGVAIVGAEFFNRKVVRQEILEDIKTLFGAVDTDSDPSLEFLKDAIVVSAKPDVNSTEGDTYVTLVLRGL